MNKFSVNGQFPLGCIARGCSSRLLAWTLLANSQSEWKNAYQMSTDFTNSGTLLGQLIWIGIGGNGQIELTNISQKRIIYFDNLWFGGRLYGGALRRFVLVGYLWWMISFTDGTAVM